MQVVIECCRGALATCKYAKIICKIYVPMDEHPGTLVGDGTMHAQLMKAVALIAAELTTVCVGICRLALSRTATQVTAGSAAAVCIGRHHFATSGEGASLRQSADQHLQARLISLNTAASDRSPSSIHCVRYPCDVHGPCCRAPTEIPAYVASRCTPSAPDLDSSHALQEGGPEERPVPDSTAINQQAPLSSDDKGEPQVGKV